MEKMTKPVTNMEMLMLSGVYVAEWRWKKEEWFRPNELNTTLHPCDPKDPNSQSKEGTQRQAKQHTTA
jgi:hypothetical protein